MRRALWCQVGERLGIGVTSVLTIEVSKATFSPIVPICGEMLWLELFFLINFLFTIGSFVESMIVLALAYHQEVRDKTRIARASTSAY